MPAGVFVDDSLIPTGPSSKTASPTSEPLSRDTVARRTWSMLPILAALLWTLGLILLASGCCSTQPGVTTIQPGGRPSQATTQRLARELGAATVSEDGTVMVPAATIRDLVKHLDEWRSYARALEISGGIK